MASIVNRPNGYKWIQFKGPTKKRHTIHLGQVSRQHAEEFRNRIQSLLAAKIMKSSIDADTARWVAGISPQMHAKVARRWVLSKAARRRLWALSWMISSSHCRLERRPGGRSP